MCPAKRDERIFSEVDHESQRSDVNLSYLDTLMAAEVKVEFRRMGYTHVDGRACRYITALATLFLFIRAEQARVMPLLHYDERYAWSVVSLQLDTCLTDGS